MPALFYYYTVFLTFEITAEKTNSKLKSIESATVVHRYAMHACNVQ